MLFQELGKMKRSWIMTSLIMIAIGVVMIMCPVSYMGMLVSILGYVLLIGASTTILDFLSSKKVLINYIYLTGGLITGLLGLYVLLMRNEVLLILKLIFGLMLVVGGINDLRTAFTYARRAGSGVWKALVALSLVSIVFGVILLINPWWDTTEALKMVVGVMMLLSSVISIVRVILTWPFKNE